MEYEYEGYQYFISPDNPLHKAAKNPIVASSVVRQDGAPSLWMRHNVRRVADCSGQWRTLTLTSGNQFGVALGSAEQVMTPWRPYLMECADTQ
jgi:hypothetical protein